MAYIEDPDYQRRIHTQLNHHESRHALAIFHGDKGHLRQRYREGQEDQLSAVGLVVNCVTLWNTVYTQHALDHLARNRHPHRRHRRRTTLTAALVLLVDPIRRPARPGVT